MELKKLPVTLLSGFSDEGKALFGKNMVQNKDGKKVVLFTTNIEKCRF